MCNSTLDITDVSNANNNMHEITFIVIQGATCSGKSTFTNFLLKELSKHKRTKVITIDDYYKSSARLPFNRICIRQPSSNGLGRVGSNFTRLNGWKEND